MATLFKQYIESPTQDFDTIDNVDSTLIHIYSIMMNHQDFSIKRKNNHYVESIDSISHLAHCGRATTTRKINQLIEMGLLKRTWTRRDMNVWQVMPLDNLVSDWPRRKSNREEWEDRFLMNQNELSRIKMNQNDSTDVQNDSTDVQNDSGNSSNSNSQSNSKDSSYKATQDDAPINSISSTVSPFPTVSKVNRGGDPYAISPEKQKLADEEKERRDYVKQHGEPF